MSFTFVDMKTNYDGASNPSFTVGPIAVAEGDLIVLSVGWEDTNTTVSSVTDGAGNSLIVGDRLNDAAGDYFTYCYRLAGVANAAATFTITFATSVGYKEAYVCVHHPPTGKVASLNGPSPNSGISASVVTGALTLPDSELCVAACKIYNWYDFSSMAVGGGAADHTLDGALGAMWTKETTGASITGTATSSGSDSWVASLIAFQATDAIPPITDAPEKLRVVTGARWR